MSTNQTLKSLISQRLTAADEEIFGMFEGTIARYEEEISRSKEANEQQRKLLDAVFNQRGNKRADVQQLLVVKEEVPPEPPRIKEEQKVPGPPHVKQEQKGL